MWALRGLLCRPAIALISVAAAYVIVQLTVIAKRP